MKNLLHFDAPKKERLSPYDFAIGVLACILSSFFAAKGFGLSVGIISFIVLFMCLVIFFAFRNSSC